MNAGKMLDTLRAKAETLQVEEHPAVLAWNTLRPRNAAPKAVQNLKVGRRQGVFRLSGFSEGSPQVVAKRLGRKEAFREQVIHNRVLRHLPISHPGFIGLVEEPQSNLWWIFLEDVTGENYSPKNREHRLLAGNWLGTMHALATTYLASVTLPDRSHEYYLRKMLIAYKMIDQCMSNSMLRKIDRQKLKSILTYFKDVQSIWSQIVKFCRGSPRTLVHGDLVVKNVQIVQTHEGYLLMPFDWGTTGGWSIPATDLAQNLDGTISPDLNSYRNAVNENGLYLTIDDVEIIARIGNLFRLIASINWESESLEFEWIGRSMENMRIYESELRDWLRNFSLS